MSPTPGGYQEIHQPRNRYRIINLHSLKELTGCKDIQTLQQHTQWLSDKLLINNSMWDRAWTESLAVGSESFVDEVQASLGINAGNRKASNSEGKYILREARVHYNSHLDTENRGLSADNQPLWDGI